MTHMSHMNHFTLLCEVWTHTAASLVAGVATTTAAVPFDLASTKMAVATGEQPYRGVFGCLMHTMRTGGISSCFTGWTALYMRFGPSSLVTFVLWEKLKVLFHEGNL